MTSVKLKGDSGSVSITVLSYERSNPENTSDANWLDCRIDVDISPFSGSVKVPLCTSDFDIFLRQVSNILDGSSHDANFETDEGIFNLHMHLTSLGRLETNGVIVTHSVKFAFNSQSDQSYLREIEQELAGVLESFPVRHL